MERRDLILVVDRRHNVLTESQSILLSEGLGEFKITTARDEARANDILFSEQWKKRGALTIADVKFFDFLLGVRKNNTGARLVLAGPCGKKNDKKMETSLRKNRIHFLLKPFSGLDLRVKIPIFLDVRSPSALWDIAAS